MGAREAVEQFLPPGLAEALVMQVDELIELAKLLAPTIRNFTESMRKNLSPGKG